MAFDHTKLTRLSGPLSPVYPPEGQAQYWAYRTEEAIETVSASAFFPDTCGILNSDIVWLYLSDGGSPPNYTTVIKRARTV